LGGVGWSVLLFVSAVGGVETKAELNTMHVRVIRREACRGMRGISEREGKHT